MKREVPLRSSPRSNVCWTNGSDKEGVEDLAAVQRVAAVIAASEASSDLAAKRLHEIHRLRGEDCQYCAKTLGKDDADTSRYVRSFALDVLARFEHEEVLGLVHATMARPFTWPDAQGRFENGGFFGLVEFYDSLSDHDIGRLRRG